MSRDTVYSSINRRADEDTTKKENKIKLCKPMYIINDTEAKIFFLSSILIEACYIDKPYYDS